MTFFASSSYLFYSFPFFFFSSEHNAFLEHLELFIWLYFNIISIKIWQTKGLKLSISNYTHLPIILLTSFQWQTVCLKKDFGPVFLNICDVYLHF